MICKNQKEIDLPLIGGESINLLIERSPKAKRMRLRIDRLKRRAVLILTKRSSERAGIAFAAEHGDWLKDQLALLPEKNVFADGFRFSLLGEEVVIRHSPLARRGVWLDEHVVWVSGEASHLSRRTTDFIKEHFKKYAKSRLKATSEILGVHVGRLSIRDTKSRWGSCNRKGDISLSWRLALAPKEVADYVIIHEISHIKEMNHSESFWRTVSGVMPDYKIRERWLKKNAAYLYSFGA